MLPIALAFFQQVAEAPAAVIDGMLELIVDGVRKEKLIALLRQAALDMARIRKLARPGFACWAIAVFGLHGDGRCNAQPRG
eukprot:2572053-Pleurochrysis_carterae.AAC.1